MTINCEILRSKIWNILKCPFFQRLGARYTPGGQGLIPKNHIFSNKYYEWIIILFLGYFSQN